MKKRTHTHPCEFQKNGCTNLLQCDGEYERNYDGIPEVVCVVYHLSPDGQQPCAPCQESRCSECGSVTRLEAHDEHCAVLSLQLAQGRV